MEAKINVKYLNALALFNTQFTFRHTLNISLRTSHVSDMSKLYIESRLKITLRFMGCRRCKTLYYIVDNNHKYTKLTSRHKIHTHKIKISCIMHVLCISGHSASMSFIVVPECVYRYCVVSYRLIV